MLNLVKVLVVMTVVVSGVAAQFVPPDNIIRNGSFDLGLTDNGTNVWNLQGDAKGNINVHNQALRCTVITTNSNNNELRVIQSGNWIKLDNGVKYRLTFTAWAAAPRTITPRVTNPTRTIVHLPDTLALLTTTPQTFTREFTMTRDEDNGAVFFACANDSPTWYLDDVRLVAISPLIPPSLTLPTAADIDYGAVLSSSDLSGGSDIGTWAWSNGEEIPTVANDGYEVTFTPDEYGQLDWSVIEGWDDATSTVRQTVSITVNPAPLTLTAEDKSIFIGGEEPDYTYTLDGFVNDEDEDVVDFSALAFDLDRDFDSSEEGAFTVTPSGAVAENYEITHVSGTLTVTCNHDWSILITVTEPTCTEKGEGYRKCSKCDTEDSENTFEIPELGHGWDEWELTAPVTCETDGEETRECKHDPEHSESRPVEALGHGWDEWEVSTEPTEEAEGEETRVCKHDATHTETRPIEKLEPTSIRDICRGDCPQSPAILKQTVVSDKMEIVPDGVTRVVIYDALGNLVYTGSDSIWDLRNSAGRRVAEGTYLVTAEVRGRDGTVRWYSARLGVKR